ncbi:MAG: hypothetical protein R3E48_08570 [Burkholderiaceae bacterium]
MIQALHQRGLAPLVYAVDADFIPGEIDTDEYDGYVGLRRLLGTGKCLSFVRAQGMSDCRCYNPPFDYRDFTSVPIGIDKTNGRHGEVSEETCRLCGTKWLHYLVEYEAFTAAGRWFRAPISDDALATLTPEQSVPFIEQQPWHFRGGSYFGSRGRRASGAVYADM